MAEATGNMTITTPRDQWPQWLRDADTHDARVEIVDGYVVWHGGTWHGGVWRGGTWHGGTWIGGTWRGGVWRDPHVLDRLAYMLSMLGCVFGADGVATAYRSVSADLRGRCFPSFVQPRNQRVSVEHDPAGSGTCTAGLHASSAPVAWRYYGVDPTARLIRITFRRDDVLDCDGEKIRLAGGYCEEIPWPWAAAADTGATGWRQ